jgi:hypothetical protein
VTGVVRHIRYVNRLAKLIKLPGGKRLHDAFDDAQAAIAEIEADCVAAIDERIAQVSALATTEGPAAGAKIYDLSNEIIALAGVFSLGDLGRASYSLCDLIDSTLAQGGCSPSALRVHVESLKLLRYPDKLGPVGVGAVLDGLAKVVAHARAQSIDDSAT